MHEPKQIQNHELVKQALPFSFCVFNNGKKKNLKAVPISLTYQAVLAM